MQWDALWNRARADLLIRTEHGDEDVFLWEHSVRVADHAQKILTLEEVRVAGADEGAVVAAALYHEAGWLARIQGGEIGRADVLLRPLSLAHREQGALLLTERLAGMLPQESLVRAANAVRGLNVREIDAVEARVLMDADNLEEFGVMAFWAMVRRGLVEGKGVQAAIDTWHRRKEYHFWDARLKDSFRFPAVRAIAEQRLARLERLMREVEEQHSGHDVSFSGAAGRTRPANPGQIRRAASSFPSPGPASPS